jgi:hypothetical protein
MFTNGFADTISRSVLTVWTGNEFYQIRSSFILKEERRGGVELFTRMLYRITYLWCHCEPPVLWAVKQSLTGGEIASAASNAASQ